MTSYEEDDMNDTRPEVQRRTYKTEEVHIISGLSVSNLCERARKGECDQTLRPFRSGRTWVWPKVYVDAMFPPAEEDAA